VHDLFKHAKLACICVTHIQAVCRYIHTYGVYCDTPWVWRRGIVQWCRSFFISFGCHFPWTLVLHLCLLKQTRSKCAASISISTHSQAMRRKARMRCTRRVLFWISRRRHWVHYSFLGRIKMSLDEASIVCITLQLTTVASWSFSIQRRTVESFIIFSVLWYVFRCLGPWHSVVSLWRSRQEGMIVILLTHPEEILETIHQDANY
jgi:hypothetical protein